ncbi:hypothetical protein F383_25033 [Gossypium arboreum]|uniref:Uncharacterized protein n=1 Tax=Gossypium arboreum TaxID=29729 RepID=A0A0B0MTQ8_GOSAR|nr:hypothetical protein F383_25033 [Gossypium arboreum]
MIPIPNVPESDTCSHHNSFSWDARSTVQNHKDMRIARKARTMPTSQTWSYM